MPRTDARIALFMAVSILVALAAAPPPVTAEADRHARPTAPARAAVAAADAAPSQLTPLIADFDGDRRGDVFWYGPGELSDHLWLGRADRNFVGVPQVVNGAYLPLTGDFNGDGPRDVLWYGAGSVADALWLGRPGGKFAVRALAVTHDSQPVVGDFNGDRRSDVLWYVAGAGSDAVWYGRADGTFAVGTSTITGTFRPLPGDFNGDGRADVLWYGAGSAPDLLWLGRLGGGFVARATRVSGTYKPFVSDFNGDRRTDIFWYAPGAAGDVVWYGRADGTFGARYPVVNGTYQPVVGDFNGDGPRDVIWYGAGGAVDWLWRGRTTASFTQSSLAVSGTYEPQVGDFGGDAIADVLWYARGAGDDVLWYGRSTTGFTSRRTTIDLEYARALPLRPDVQQDERYNPYGFVAHALGAIGGYSRTNTLEAFERNYERGIRVFECDQVLLKDGTVLIAHDGSEAYYGLNKSFREATWADLAGHKYRDQYTILRSEDLVRLATEHPDVYFILDIKYGAIDVYRRFISQATTRSVRERLLPHVRDQAELNGMRAIHPLQNYVLALYKTQFQNRFDDPEVATFTRSNRTPGVMMFWRDRDPSLTLADNGRQSRRYTPALAASLKAAGAATFVHSLTDPQEIQRFWDLDVGVYTDEPFPPLGSEPTTLVAPKYTEGVTGD